MILLHGELIKQNGDLYITMLKIPDRQGIQGEEIDKIKSRIGADKAFRNNGKIYLCHLIEEAEIVTDKK